MLVFVDESGCSGFKIGAGSTVHFTVTAVLFKDRRVAQECDDSIADLRRRLGLSKHKEFHFSKDSPSIRTEFLSHVARFEFSYAAFIANKAKLIGPGFRFKGPFYKYPIGLLFKNIKAELSSAVVIYDRCGDRNFVSELGNYLKKQLRNDDGSQTSIRKFRAEASKSNNLIQLADMVCGAIAWSMHRERKQHYSYRQLICHRELGVQLWPK